MSLEPHPEMAAILREMQAVPAPDYRHMPIAEARQTFEQTWAIWNQPCPEMAARNLSISGVRCRLSDPGGSSSRLIVWVHGGGWTFGTPEAYERFARLLAQDAACPVLMPDYRLAPEHPCPAGIEDTLAVLRGLSSVENPVLRQASSIILGGDSAGANIALAAALERECPPLAALLLLYGCFEPRFETQSHRDCGDGRFGLMTDRMRWYWSNWQGAAHDARGVPLAAELTGLPHTYVMAAGLDPLRDDSTELASRLAAAGVSVRLDVVPGVIHGFLQMSSRLSPARQAIETIARETRGR
jgi:acetyl esterase/lipase